MTLFNINSSIRFLQSKGEKHHVDQVSVNNADFEENSYRLNEDLMEEGRRKGSHTEGRRRDVLTGDRPGNTNAQKGDLQLEGVSNEQVMNLIFLIICVLGFVANVIYIIVLQKVKNQRQACHFNRLILGLILTNSIYLLVTLSHVTLEFSQSLVSSDSLDSKMELWSRIYYLLQTISIYITCVIVTMVTLERLISLVKPFNVTEFFIVRHGVKITIAISSFISLIILLFPVMATIFDKRLPNNTMGESVRTGEEFLNVMKPFKLIVFDCMLYCMLLFGSVAISIAYAQFIKKRQSIVSTAANLTSAQSAYTVSAIIIAMIYLLLLLSYVIADILPNGKSGLPMSQLRTFRQCITIICASVTGAIVIFPSKANRDILSQTINCCKSHEHEIANTSVDSTKTTKSQIISK